MANEITKITDQNSVDHPLRDAAAQTALTGILDGTTIDSFGDVEAALSGKVDTSSLGANSGVATLDANGKVPSSQIPAGVGTAVEGNPTEAATAGDLTKIKIDSDVYSIPSGGGSGTTVVPNPSGIATADLNKVQIGTDIYSIPQTDISGKADKVSSPTSGDFASLDSNGNLTDSGKKASDFASSAIMDGQSIDSFGDVESALEGYFPRSEQAVLGAKNIAENKKGTITDNGVTWTLNSDGSVTANGTASPYASIYYMNLSIPAKIGERYIVSDGLAEHNQDRFARIGNSSDAYICDTKNGEVAFTAPTTTISIRLVVETGKSVSNLTFYPMIRLASDPDDTYAPYAKTNRELTETKADVVNYSTSEQKLNEKWIDGKPIYQKTIDCGSLPNNTTKDVAHGISNIKKLVKISGAAYTSSGTVIGISLPNSSTTSGGVEIKLAGENINIKTIQDMSGFDTSYVTLKYTKTTD